MYRVTDVVKHLLILNIGLFVVTIFFMSDPAATTMNRLVGGQLAELSHWGRLQLAMFFPASDFFRPYQIITHMFMHSGIAHLFFNMFVLFMFGPPLETLWGPKRFLFFYFFCGFGALLLHLFVKYLEIYHFGGPIWEINIPMLGASGAIFGLLLGFGVKFPETRLMLLIPPIPIKAKYFVVFLVVLELFLGISRMSSGIAHFAHLGGALFGFLLILYWSKFPSKL
ncbi:MAG: rhomboid family intramembrane serine protease [Saprospirales bacterium]|nr:MAG: rhomboid family intramembrane serine protease [Saprospirales bacterium]